MGLVLIKLDRSNTITIIKPTLNKEESIKKTIDSIPHDNLNGVYHVEILFVDGKSIDKTVNVAKETGAKVIVEENSGYGGSNKTGCLQGSGETIVTIDADATYQPKRYPSIYYL
jgi:glycosyltransferase involved in cell wall biosynthesis